MTTEPQTTTRNIKPLKKKHDAWLYAILSIVSSLPYVSTLWNGFVFDDHFQVLDNPYLQSFRFVKQIFMTSVWSFQNTRAITNFYRPMMSLQYLLIYQTYGPLAYAFHLANVLLHVAVVLLLFSVTRKLLNSTRVAFCAAALFALHPIHTEVVAWVAAVPDLQLSLFLLGSFWFYLDFGDIQRQRWWTPVGTCLFFALALLSKEPAVMFPLAATAYEHFFRANRATTPWRLKLSRYAPLWLLTILYLFCRVQFMGRLVPNPLRAQLPWPSTILSAFSLFGQYMNLLIWPSPLSIFHPFVPSISPFQPAVLVGVAWALGLTMTLWVLWKKTKTVSFSVVWMIVLLAPALNARWMPGSALAERYLYVPSIGFCWLAAAGLVKLWDMGKQRRTLWLRIAVATTAIAIAVMSVIQIQTRDAKWRDDLTFYSDAVDQSPTNATLHSNLGFAYWEARKEVPAIQEWNIALRLNPNDIFALDNLGMVAIHEKRYVDAIPLLRHALSIQPALTESHLKLGRALAGLNLLDQAESEYRTAIDISPLDWNVHNQAAGFYRDAGRMDMAVMEYQSSINSIINTEALDGLGDISVERGQVNLAEKYFQEATELNQFDHHAHYQLVCIYGKSSRDALALREYDLAQRTDPGIDTLGQKAKQVVEEIRKKNNH